MMHTKSVSYTHLDVYKRQLWKRSKKVKASTKSGSAADTVYTPKLWYYPIIIISYVPRGSERFNFHAALAMEETESECV